MKEIKLYIKNPYKFKIIKKGMPPTYIYGLKFIIKSLEFDMKNLFLFGTLKSFIVLSRKGFGYSHIILNESNRKLKFFNLYEFYYNDKRIPFDMFIEKLLEEISSNYEKFNFKDYLSNSSKKCFQKFYREISKTDKELTQKFLSIISTRYYKNLEKSFDKKLTTKDFKKILEKNHREILNKYFISIIKKEVLCK